MSDRPLTQGPDTAAATAVPADGGASLAESDPDRALPVVARLMVEVRSDGRRTVARGYVEDLASGQRTQLTARGDSPAALLVSLLQSVTRLAGVARRAVRALVSPPSSRR